MVEAKRRDASGIVFFVMFLTSGGPWAPPAKPSPPLPKHVLVYRGRPYGFFVVDHGYSYLSHILCKYGGGESEPKIAAMPSGQELVTCMAYEGESGEPFTYGRTQEYVE
jgi:hypothetical protein